MGIRVFYPVGLFILIGGKCRADISSLNPTVERMEIEVEGRAYGASTPPFKPHPEFAAPRQGVP